MLKIHEKSTAWKPKKLSAAMKKKIYSAMQQANSVELMQLEEALETGIIPDDPFITMLLQQRS